MTVRERAEREVGEKWGWKLVATSDEGYYFKLVSNGNNEISYDVFHQPHPIVALWSLCVSQREREIECEGLLRLVVEERTYLRDTKPEFKHLGDKLLYCKTCQYPYGGHGDACLIGEIEKFLKKGTPNAT